MVDVLLTLVLILVIWLALVAVALAGSLWYLRRHNRVCRTEPTPAPVSWLWSPTAGARLHRRLRAVGRLVEPRGESDELRRRLLRQAVLLDAHVVHAARAPRRHRRTGLLAAGRQVTELEELVARLHVLARPVGVAGDRWTLDATRDHEALESLRHHVASLEAAHAEVALLERQAGLGQPPDLPRQQVSPRPTGR